MKKIFFYGLGLMSLCLFQSCNSDAPQTRKESVEQAQLKPSEQAQKALNQVLELPEIRRIITRMKEISGGRSTVEALIVDTPSTQVNAYEIAVVENRMGEIIPLEHFRVYLEEAQVRVYYPKEAREESIEDWRTH